VDRWQLGADEREARILVRILETLEEILAWLPKPPEYPPTVGITVAPSNEVSTTKAS
jgi:hypothetical protein